LYGQIVAGYPGTEKAYLIPMAQIFKDIELLVGPVIISPNRDEVKSKGTSPLKELNTFPGVKHPQEFRPESVFSWSGKERMEQKQEKGATKFLTRMKTVLKRSDGSKRLSFAGRRSESASDKGKSRAALETKITNELRAKRLGDEEPEPIEAPQVHEIHELPAVEPVGSELSVPREAGIKGIERDNWPASSSHPLPLSPLPLLFSMAELRDSRAENSSPKDDSFFYNP
jgi:hypothetical protein